MKEDKPKQEIFNSKSNKSAFNFISDMSKEQTPITALQTLMHETNAPEFTDELDLICESYLVISNIMEQYANTKVLEALEPIEEKLKK